MITGPIFRVELLTAARRRRYFALRIFYSAVILFVLWVTYENVKTYNTFTSGGTTSISEMARSAAAFFYTFSWVQVIGILLAAPAMAVGTIATERERRTIEYLFATDLSNLEIVLGKTFARLLLIGQLVLTSLPILFIFRLMGGIPADLLAASFLIAASTGLLVTAISVCISVWSPRARDAAMRVYRVLAVLVIGPILLTVLFTMLNSSNLGFRIARDFNGFLMEINPLTVLAASMGNVFAMGVAFDFQPVLKMAAWHVGISVALVALATMAVRRVHLRESSRGTTKKREPWQPRWLQRWKPTMGNEAMFWKEAFAPTAKTKLGFVGMAANVIIVLVAIVWTGYAFYHAALNISFWSEEEYFIYTMIFTGVIGCGLLLLLGARASSLITVEKERDTWISLLSTPLSAQEIVFGKLLGNLYHARWGVLLMAIAWGLGVLFEITFLAVIPVLLGTYLLCAVFVTSVGLMYSLRSKTSLRSMGLTLFTIMFVGGGYLLCCCPVFAIIASSSNSSDELMQLGFAPCVPFLVAAPVGFFAESYNRAPEGELLTSWVAGIVFYLFVSGILASQLVMQFDGAAGRTSDMPDAARPSPFGKGLAES